MLQLARTTQFDQQLKFSHATDTGQPDTQNSDAYLIFPTEGAAPWQEQPESIWFVLLANGDQDHPSSRVASQLAVESVYQELVDQEKIGHSIAKRLDAALQQAHTNILETSLGEPDLLGMQTSMLAAAVRAGNVHFARTGDYGAFLYRDGLVHHILLENSSTSQARDGYGPLLTRAETTSLQTTGVADAFGLGNVSGVEIAKKVRLQELDHQQRAQQNSTARQNSAPNGDAPSNSWFPEADTLLGESTKQLALLPNDVLILCSSSMTAALTPINIRTAIANHPLTEVADQLVRLVKERGVEDDCTAVVVRWTGETVLPEKAALNHASFNWSLRKSALVLMTALIASGIWFAAGTFLGGQTGVASQNQAAGVEVRATFAEEIAPDTATLGATLADVDATTTVNVTAETVAGSTVAELADAEPTDAESNNALPANLALSAPIPTNAEAAVQAAIETGDRVVIANPFPEQVDLLAAQSQEQMGQAADSAMPQAAGTDSTELEATSEVAEPTTSVVVVDNLVALLSSLHVTANSVEQGLQAEGHLPLTAIEELATEPTSSEAAAEEATAEVALAEVLSLETAGQVNAPVVQPIEPAVPAPAAIANAEPEAIDNVVFVSESEPISVAEVAISTATIYLLKEGDNLWAIAWENNLTVEDLLVANPFITSKEQILSIGTALVIPNTK